MARPQQIRLVSWSFTRHLEVGSWVAAILGIVAWSAWPAIKALTATLQLRPVSKHAVVQGTDSARLEVQRIVQKQFLDYGVYVPLEDIMFAEYFAKKNVEFEPVLRRVCGDAPLIVWVPLQFRLPIIGERSLEWCWKPSLKN